MNQTTRQRYRGDIKRVAVGDVLAIGEPHGFGRRLRVTAIDYRARRVTLKVISPPSSRRKVTHDLSIIGSWLVIESPRDTKGG